jgi:hypothetical protein
MMTEKTAEFDDERDWYDELLDRIDRTLEHDERVSIHECGHLLVNRLICNSTISEVTINPGDGFEGICRGARREAFVSGTATGADAADVRKTLQPVMPRTGEGRSDVADVFQSVLDACTELMAGEVAEKMLLEGPAAFASDDRRQVGELAALICKSPRAVEAFIAFCEQQAADLLSEHVTVMMSLQIVLRIRRIMTGHEIDRAIATVLAGQAAAVESIRRARWQRVVENAASFEAECVASHKEDRCERGPPRAACAREN